MSPDNFAEEFITGSAIDPSFLSSGIFIRSEFEAPVGGDPTYPIHALLDREPPKRWSLKGREPYIAAVFLQENGECWQVKPEPHWDLGGKYVAPTGIGNRAYFPPVPSSIRKKIGERYGVNVPLEGSFWEWLKTTNLPRIITEGAKKCLSLLSQGFVAIGVYGCQCLHSPDLVPFLKNAPVYLAFDQDAKRSTRWTVAWAIKTQGEPLTLRHGCDLRVIEWAADWGKGVDDVLSNDGLSVIEHGINIAKSLPEWAHKNPDLSIPNSNIFASEFADRNRHKWVFCLEEQRWYQCLNNIWKPCDKRIIGCEISKAYEKVFGAKPSANYRNTALDMLCDWLHIPEFPNQTDRILSFKNGVLDLHSNQFSPHRPDRFLTWALPHDYDPSCIEFSNIAAFLDESTGDCRKLVEAYYAAVLRGSSHLHKVAQFIGEGGTGKSTTLKLLIGLIGQENVHSTTLSQFCENRFDAYHARHKRLVTFSDQSRFSGDLQKFRNASGGDLISAEIKNGPSVQFSFNGLMVITSNPNVFCESGSWLDRRLLPIPFNRKPVNPDSHLIDKLLPEAAAFTNYLLATYTEEVIEKIITTCQPSSVLEAKREAAVDGDNVAAWLAENTVIDSDAFVPTRELYQVYKVWCESDARRPKSERQFSLSLASIGNTGTFGKFEAKRTSSVRGFIGIRLKKEWEKPIGYTEPEVIPHTEECLDCPETVSTSTPEIEVPEKRIPKAGDLVMILPIPFENIYNRKMPCNETLTGDFRVISVKAGKFKIKPLIPDPDMPWFEPEVPLECLYRKLGLKPPSFYDDFSCS